MLNPCHSSSGLCNISRTISDQFISPNDIKQQKPLNSQEKGKKKDVSIEIEEIDHRTLQSEVLAEGSHLSPGTINRF